MCSLHHPSPCSPPRTLFHTLHFFSPRSEVGDEVKSLKQYTHFIEVVSFIHTPTLSFLFCRPRSFDGNARDRLFRHLEIISIRSINGKADGDTSSFSEHTPFCPLFCAVSGNRPSFFPLQAAPSSSLHPWNRNSSQCLWRCCINAPPSPVI